MSTFWKRQAKAQIGDHGRASEKRVAKAMGAKLTVGSGNKQRDKGDMKLYARLPFRMEAKATKNDSISLKVDWLLKIWHEAFNKDENPALVISFVTSEGKSIGPGGEWVAIPRHVFEELTEK